MSKKDYCTQNDGDCSSCSLVNYGRDCRNNPINPTMQDLDTLWARYMGDVTTPMEYRAQVVAEGGNIPQALEYDLEFMYLATGEMSPDEIKAAARDIYQAMETEKAYQAALEIRANKIQRRGPQVFRH